MYWLVFLLALIVISVVIKSLPQSEEYFSNTPNSVVTYPADENIFNKDPLVCDTTILEAPNIPVDPRVSYKIGGKYCNKLDESIASTQGKYKFPIPKLMYDGIWESNVNINDNNIETQIWTMPNYIPTEGVYATNDFLKVPEKEIPLYGHVYEKNVFGKPSKPIYDLGFYCQRGTDDTLGVVYISPGIGTKPIYP